MRDAKIAKNSPFAHHRTTLSGHNFATKAHVDNRKKRVKQQYLPHMSLQYGELRPTSGWDRSGGLGHPQLISTGFASWQRYCTLTLVVGVSQTLRRWTPAEYRWHPLFIDQRVPPIFDRAAITLGIGPHSSLYLFFQQPIVTDLGQCAIYCQITQCFVCCISTSHFTTKWNNFLALYSDLRSFVFFH